MKKQGQLQRPYQKVCDGLDGILAKTRLSQGGTLIARSVHNEDTIVLFCHMGVTFYMLSHLLSISQVCLADHTMFLPPSSVTVVSTEEVEQGLSDVRTQMLGDTRLTSTAPGSPVPWDILRGFCRGVRYDRTAGHGRCTIGTSAWGRIVCAICHSARLRYAQSVVLPIADTVLHTARTLTRISFPEDEREQLKSDFAPGSKKDASTIRSSYRFAACPEKEDRLATSVTLGKVDEYCRKSFKSRTSCWKVIWIETLAGEALMEAYSRFHAEIHRRTGWL